MKYLILGLKGVAYGITHIAPGLGGGLILIVLGIYEQFVDAVGNFFVKRNKWKEYLAFLVPLGIGMVLGMLILARLITLLLENYPAATMFFFMGLLVGTIPSILRLHGDMHLTVGRGLALLCGLLLIVGLKTIEPSGNLGESVQSISNTRGIIYNAIVSFIAGGASVTPGLDGSYILLLGGTYAPIIEAVAELSKLVIHWGALLSTGIGAILGIATFSKLIDTAIKRAPSLSYYGILGLVAGSVYGLWPKEPAKAGIVVLALAFVAGSALALLFSKPTEAEQTE